MSNAQVGRQWKAPVRRDLQGVRGVGITMVVVGHLFQWPHGAFTALDMLFVLSGFLITGILIDASATWGRILFTPFYLARTRRLLPNAILAITVTVIAYYVFFSAARADQVREDGFWALIFASNWHFAQSESNYFQAQTQSPLVFFWSLSVEEQFYMVWPLLLLVSLFLAARSRRPTAVLAGCLGVVTVGAFAYSLWHSATSPAVAYYSTFDRAWEFGIGGLLAVFRSSIMKIPPRIGRVLVAFGLVGLVVQVFLLQPTVAFPAPWALVPVAMTAAMVAGGINPETPRIKSLDNPVMVYLGDISYSVYLWHLPAIMVMAALVSPGPGYYVASLAAVAFLSIAAYHLVERPMRFAPWLMTPLERLVSQEISAKTRQRRQVAGVTVVGVLTVGMVALALAPPTVPESSVPQAVKTPAAPERPQGPLEEQRDRLIAALRATDFPAFAPPLEALGFDSWAARQVEDGCVDVVVDNLDDCAFGKAGATRTAVVVGDSYGIAWMPGIRAALEPRGWRVQQLTKAQCGAWTLPSYVELGGAPYPACADHHDLVSSYVESERPDLVILASAFQQVRNAERPDITGGPVEVAEAGLGATLDDLAPAGSRIVVLGSPPALTDLVGCVTRFGSPEDCTSSPSQEWFDDVAGESAAAASHGVDYVQTEPWFCVERRCPGFVGTTPVTADGGHLWPDYAAQLGPLLRQALLPHDR